MTLFSSVGYAEYVTDCCVVCRMSLCVVILCVIDEQRCVERAVAVNGEKIRYNV
jgi:hypothetical protein